MAYRDTKFSNCSCSELHANARGHAPFRELPHIYAITFFRDHCNKNLAVRDKLRVIFGSSQLNGVRVAVVQENLFLFTLVY
jgi:hypothetical protein